MDFMSSFMTNYFMDGFSFASSSSGGSERKCVAIKSECDFVDAHGNFSGNKSMLSANLKVSFALKASYFEIDEAFVRSNNGRKPIAIQQWMPSKTDNKSMFGIFNKSKHSFFPHILFPSDMTCITLLENLKFRKNVSYILFIESNKKNGVTQAGQNGKPDEVVIRSFEVYCLSSSRFSEHAHEHFLALFFEVIFTSFFAFSTSHSKNFHDIL